MLVTPDYQIQRLVINMQDLSLLTFQLDGEKLNPPWTTRCSSSRCRPAPRWWTPKGANSGRVRSEVRRPARRNAPAGGRSGSERELRDRFSQQGFLIYSVKPRREIAGMAMGGGKKKINLEKFLIFNQQFVTLIRAGLPILKALDLLSERLTDAKLAPHIKASGKR
jgi:hypothetical protein